MAHGTITGISGCGKSRLVKQVLIPQARAAGIPTLVLDPVIPPHAAKGEWGADACFQDAAAFIRTLKASRQCMAFVDEMGIWQKDTASLREIEWLAMAGRNWGHVGWFMAQRRVQMIPPNIRNQCDKAFVFNAAREDLRDFADAYNIPQVMDALNFPKGVAYIIKPMEKPRKIRVF